MHNLFQMMFTVIQKLYMNLKNMTRSAVRVLVVFWLHTSKPANTRSCGVLSSFVLCCLMDRLVLNVALA